MAIFISIYDWVHNLTEECLFFVFSNVSRHFDKQKQKRVWAKKLMRKANKSDGARCGELAKKKIVFSPTMALLHCHPKSPIMQETKS